MSTRPECDGNSRSTDSTRVQATVNLSQSKTPEGLKRVIEGRIQALANVHTLFVESRWKGAQLSILARRELAPYLQDNEPRAHIDGPELLLAPNTAQTMAMILHELATNAAKYGALSVPKGHVEIKWSLAAKDQLTFTWTEKGGPVVKKPTRQGFGTRALDTNTRATCASTGGRKVLPAKLSFQYESVDQRRYFTLPGSAC
jgi:two-component sensor histidine kinase